MKARPGTPLSLSIDGEVVARAEPAIVGGERDSRGRGPRGSEKR